MRKPIIFSFVIFLFACSGKKTAETSTPAADTLMDSTEINLRADTTVKRLDHLQDSINKLREKAADKAGQQN